MWNKKKYIMCIYVSVYMCIYKHRDGRVGKRKILACIRLHCLQLSSRLSENRKQGMVTHKGMDVREAFIYVLAEFVR